MSFTLVFRDPGEAGMSRALRPAIATVCHKYSAHPKELPPAQGPVPEPIEMGFFRELHLLRGYAAHIETKGVPPAKPDRRVGAYKKLLDPFYRDQRIAARYPHLICHSDCDGVYLPTEFATPFWKVSSTPWLPLVGWKDYSTASAARLLSELDDLNTYLKLPIDVDPRDVSVLNELVSEREFDIESRVWVQLREAASRCVLGGYVLEFA